MLEIRNFSLLTFKPFSSLCSESVCFWKKPFSPEWPYLLPRTLGNTLLFCILYSILVISAWFRVQSDFFQDFFSFALCCYTWTTQIYMHLNIINNTIGILICTRMCTVFSSSSGNGHWSIILYCTYFIVPGLYRNVLFINTVHALFLLHEKMYSILLLWLDCFHQTICSGDKPDSTSINICETTLCDHKDNDWIHSINKSVYMYHWETIQILKFMWPCQIRTVFPCP